MTQFNPIGYLKCERSFHEEQPRQGNLSASKAYIDLVRGHNYEQGLKDLDGFSRIWLIYEFHLNKTWRPLANPPRTDNKGRKGVFATRSPYRPNQIGISCVKLLSVVKNRIYIEDSDLLNDTPIFDIKPYIPEYDSFPKAKIGWLANVVEDVYEINYSEISKEKIDYVQSYNVDLKGVIESQLSHDIFDKTRNKFIKTDKGCILRFKSWQILFAIENKKVLIKDIFSNYSDFSDFTTPLGSDNEFDLLLHKRFFKLFS